MKVYKILWENEFTSSSPLQAVEQAMQDIEDFKSVMFTVEEYKCKTPNSEPVLIKKYSVDMNDEGNEVVEIN